MARSALGLAAVSTASAQPGPSRQSPLRTFDLDGSGLGRRIRPTAAQGTGVSDLAELRQQIASRGSTEHQARRRMTLVLLGATRRRYCQYSDRFPPAGRDWAAWACDPKHSEHEGCQQIAERGSEESREPLRDRNARLQTTYHPCCGQEERNLWHRSSVGPGRDTQQCLAIRRPTSRVRCALRGPSGSS